MEDCDTKSTMLYYKKKKLVMHFQNGTALHSASHEIAWMVHKV